MIKKIFIYLKNIIRSFDKDERKMLDALLRLECFASSGILNHDGMSKMHYDHRFIYRKINNYLLENATKEQKSHVQKMWLERHDKAQSKYHWSVGYDYEHSDHYS